MKKIFGAFVRHSPWPFRIRPPQGAEEASTILPAMALAGLLVGLQTAAVFLLAGMVLPTRIALMVSLCAGLAANMPRPATGLTQPVLSGKSALGLALMVLIKLETLAEIEHEWIAIILFCSTAWARSASLAVRIDSLSHLGKASAGSRLACLLVGGLPMLAFGLWPEPAWGLWVAGLTVLLVAKTLIPRGWAAPLIVRWVLAEAVYCVSVALLMSAAAIAEITDEAAADS